MNQFLLRLVCTNGAVVQTGKTGERVVHRGWDRDGLMRYIGEVGAETISRMDGLNEALRRIAQAKLGSEGFPNSRDLLQRHWGALA